MSKHRESAPPRPVSAASSDMHHGPGEAESDPGGLSWHWQRPEHLDFVQHRFPLRLLTQPTVGLDLGSSWLKYAVTRRGLGQPTLVAAGGIPIAARTAGQLGKLRAQVAALLTVRDRVKRSHERWIVGVSGPGTIVRIVDVPRLPRRELKKAVLWQAQKKIPFPLDDAHVAIHYLKSAPHQPVRAIVAAALKRLVDDLLYLLAEAEIKPAAITLPGFGLERLQRLQSTHEPGTCHGVLDMGAQRTTFAVYANGKLDFYREIDLGVGDEAASEPGLGHSESTGGVIAAGWRTPSAGTATEATETEHGAVLHSRGRTEETLGPLVSEIQNTLEYYAAQVGGARIHKFLVLGGGAQIPGLEQHLRALLEIPVELLNPLSRDPYAAGIAAGGLPPAYRWASAYGYSLLPRRAPNLLPADYLRQQEAEFHALLWRTATGTALAASIILSGGEFYRGQAAKDRADILASRNMEMAARLTALQAPETETRLVGHQRWLAALKRKDIRSSAILRWLSVATPSEVALDRLQIRLVDSGWAALDLAGEVRAPHDQNEVILAAYVDRLARCGYFQNVALLQHASTRRMDHEQLTFHLALNAPLEERLP